MHRIVPIVLLTALLAVAALAITTRADAQTSVVASIKKVFGRHANAALRVAYCESRHSTRATNGQYQGLFQMGAWERRTYGHGKTALQQARAAHRYFVASGRDWSPWTCKP